MDSIETRGVMQGPLDGVLGDLPALGENCAGSAGIDLRPTGNKSMQKIVYVHLLNTILRGYT